MFWLLSHSFFWRDVLKEELRKDQASLAKRLQSFANSAHGAPCPGAPARRGRPSSCRADTAARQTLQGSFSAVSKRNFASKYSLESFRRDLHNALRSTALQSHFLLSFFS